MNRQSHKSFKESSFCSLNHKIGPSYHLPIAINLLEKINLDETHSRKLRLIVINAQFFELLWILECVFALSCIFYEFIGQDLDDLGAVDGAVCEYLPLVEVFLRVVLDSKEGIVFGSECGDKVLLEWGSGVWLNFPEISKKRRSFKIILSDGKMMVKVYNPPPILQMVLQIIRNAFV